MTDHFTEQLSAYLDQELDAPMRARIESHLAGCGECRTVLDDLRDIVAAAPHYQGQAPERDLWAGIAQQLGGTEVIPLHPRRRHFGWRELIAASLLMAAAGGGATWLALRGPSPKTTAVTSPGAPAGDRPPVRNAAFAEARYDLAVRDLEQLLALGRARLDTATVRTIEQSLASIDAAISEARLAVQRDPANGYLSRQIAANMRLKLNLLRVATNAIAAKS